MKNIKLFMKIFKKYHILLKRGNNLIILIILLLFLSYFILHAANTHYISGGDYYKISSTIQTANSGDTIIITDSKEYYENQIYIQSNNITLKGADGQMPTIRDLGFLPLIFITNTWNITIENIRIIRTNKTTSYGISISSANNNTIQNCEISGEDIINTDSKGIYIYDANNNFIINCIISDLKNGIEIYHSMWSTDNYIFYNTIYNCSNGIYYNNWQDNQHIYNNTLIRNVNGIAFTPPSNNPWIYIKNNIIFNNTKWDMFFISSAMSYDVDIEHNCYFSITNESTLININTFENINHNPKFIDYAKDNFYLTPESPCIDTGMDINYGNDYGFHFLDEDKFLYNNKRDIGAHEYILEKEPEEPPLPPKSEYIELSANNLTIGKETRITLKDLRLINSKNVYIKTVIYDLKGKLIKNLFDQNVSPANNVTLTWNGKDSNGEYVGAGVYLLKVHMGSINKTRKIFFVP